MSNKNTKIVLNRQSDLILDNAKIIAPVGIVLTDIAGVSDAFDVVSKETEAAIAAEAKEREAVDAKLFEGIKNEDEARTKADAELSAEVSALISDEHEHHVAGDKALQNQIDFITNNSDPVAIDSLTEIIGAFQAADGDINGAITTLADAAAAAVTAEASIRLAADNSINSKFAANLSSEVSARIADVDAEESRAMAAEGVLTSDLSTEVSDRVAAEASLDANLKATIGQEVSIREEADAAEAKAREEGDAKLQSQIDNVLSNVDGDALDSLTEIVGAFKSADDDLNGAITLLAESASSALSAEISAREEGDEKLSESIKNEEKRAMEAEASIAEVLSTEVSYIIANTDLTSIDSFAEVVANLDNEIARAENAESLITKRVDAEYYKKLVVNEIPDGKISKFTFKTWSRSSSESIFLNGLLLTEKEDYATISVSGKIIGITFYSAPQLYDKVKAYAVYATDAVSVADINAQIAKLEMELQDMEMNMTSSKASLESAKDGLNQAIAEMNMSQQEIVMLNEDLNKTNSDVVKTQEGIAESQNFLANAEALGADLNVSIAEYEKAIAEAQANKANTEAEKAQYLADGGDDQAIIDGYDSTIASANAILADSQDSLMNARAQKAENDSMIEEFQNRLNQSEVELKAARELLKSLEAQLAQATELYSSSQASIAEIEAKIASYTKQIVELEASMSKANDSISALRKQLAELEAALGGGKK
jgi:predicted  nucleic acid-binding Zn-ribbon protein